MSHPRAFKSHLPPHVFPRGDPKLLPAKFISSYRNPKDLLVSGYFHMNSMMKRIGKPMSFDAGMIAMFPLNVDLNRVNTCRGHSYGRGLNERHVLNIFVVHQCLALLCGSPVALIDHTSPCRVARLSFCCVAHRSYQSLSCLACRLS